MEVVMKRRASTEVEELMAAVKTDYNFFAKFDAIFAEPPLRHTPGAKRQRSQSDATPNYLTGRSDVMMPVKTTNLGDRNSWNVYPTERQGKITETKPRQRHFSLPRFGEIKSSSHLTRIGSPTAFQRSQSWPLYKNVVQQGIRSSHSRISIPPTYAQDVFSSETNRETLDHFFHKITPTQREIFVEIPSDAPLDANRKRRYSFKNEFIQQVLARQSSDEDKAIKRKTRIVFGLSNDPSLYYTPPKVMRKSVDNEIFVPVSWEKPGASPVKNSHEELKRKSPANEMTTTVDQPQKTFLKSLSMEEWRNSKATNQRSPFVQDNHVDSSPTNQREGSPKHVIAVRTVKPKERQHLGILDHHILPNYVITRVGSLLQLGKDIVYPVTLEEIRRRVKDPENFSFQMLIAYVRHSRAKGRQFLDYWKCQPSGKTAKPNVLSKLCEADAKELVNGIQKVNEEYFPGEKLARNAADSFFQNLRETGNEVAPQELCIRDKVESIEKSRSVFRVLENKLSSSQNDDKFDTFNIASHNAGLVNLKNNLHFLDGILEKIQIHIKRRHRNVSSFTG